MTESTLSRGRGLPSMTRALWARAKIWNYFNLGPVDLIFRFRRAKHVSMNRRTSLKALLKRLVRQPTHRHYGRNSTDLETSLDCAHSTAFSTGVAAIIGVGPGIGEALTERLAAAGMRVAILARNIQRLEEVAARLRKRNLYVSAYGCDAADELSVQRALRSVHMELGCPELVVYAAQGFTPGSVIDMTVAAFEEDWRSNCLGAFIVGREAARLMLKTGRGTIVFTGATSGTIGRAGYINLATGKFGLRALSQVMARELWSKGIHIAHIVIDADVAETNSPTDNEPHMLSTDLADMLYRLHLQPRSAWTLELDARPWNERFWEHC